MVYLEFLEAVLLPVIAIFIAIQFPRNYRRISIGIAIVLGIWNGYVGIYTSRQLPQDLACLVVRSPTHGCPHKETFADFFPGLFGLGYPIDESPEEAAREEKIIADQLANEGRGNFLSGNYDEAVKKYSESLGHYSENPRVLCARGDAYRKEQLFEDAERDYRGTLEQDHTIAEAENGLGQSLYAEGQRDDLAVKHLRKAIELKPNYPEALTTLGLALARRGDFSGSLRAFESPLLRDADLDNDTERVYANSLKERANNEVLNGHTTEAIRDYMHALTLWSEFPEAHRGIAKTYVLLGRLNDALDQYGKALELQPIYPAALNEEGIVYELQGKYDSAIAVFSDALKIDGSFSDAFKNRGNAYNAVGKYDDAIVDFQNALSGTPNFPEAYNGLGNTYFFQEFLSDALNNYQKALSLRPDYPEAINNVGRVKETQGDFDGAIQNYSRAISLKPGLFDALFNRGALYERHHMLDRAIGDLTAAVSANPHNAEAFKLLGDAYASVGKSGIAIPFYTQAIDIDGNYADALKNRGNAKANIRDYWGAIRDYSAAIEHLDDFFEAFKNRGIAYESAGRLDLARLDLTKALELRPGDPQCVSALLVLDLISRTTMPTKLTQPQPKAAAPALGLLFPHT